MSKVSNINALNNLIFIGKLLSVHHDFFAETPRRRRSIKIKAFISIIVIVSCHISLSNINESFDVIYLTMVMSNVILCSNATVAISNSISSSHLFKDFIVSVNCTHERCKQDDLYNKSLKKLCMTNYISIVYYLSVHVLLVMVLLVSKASLIFFSVPIFLFLLTNFWALAMYIAEFVLLRTMLNILHLQLKSVNKSIVTIEKHIRNSSEKHIKQKFQIRMRKHIKMWTDNYENIVKCTNKINGIFNGQIGFAVSSAAILFSLMVYEAVALMASDKINMFHIIERVCVSFQSLILILITLNAGQRMKNEAKRMDTNVANIYNTLLSYHATPELLRSVNDLHLEIITENLEANLFSTLPLTMTLLLKYLSLCSTYIIFALQINNVV